MFRKRFLLSYKISENYLLKIANRLDSYKCKFLIYSFYIFQHTPKAILFRLKYPIKMYDKNASTGFLIVFRVSENFMTSKNTKL